MKRDFDFSEEDSERFIREFKNVTDGPMAEVAAALRSLSHIPPLPSRAKPKVVPSQISVKSSHKFKFFGGGVVTGIATIGAAIGLALGAAAVTGNLPAVISESAKKVAHVISNVFTSEPVTPITQKDQSEENNAPRVSEPALEQSQSPQQTVSTNQKEIANPQIANQGDQSTPVATLTPKPSPLAQPVVPDNSSQEDHEEPAEKEDSQETKSNSSDSEKVEGTKSEETKSEETKSESKKSEGVAENPIATSPSKSEKKESTEKNTEQKSSGSKDEKDD